MAIAEIMPITMPVETPIPNLIHNSLITPIFIHESILPYIIHGSSTTATDAKPRIADIR
jgi:hypothetical protein